MIFCLLLPFFSAAQDIFLQRAQGSFQCEESLAEQQRKKDAALKKTLSKTSIVIRHLAASRLKDKPNLCARYTFSTKDKEMKVQCDDKPKITLMLDGTPTSYPTKKGKISVIATISENRIKQSFEGDKGGLTVEYIFEADHLRVVKTISSRYLGAPLVLDTRYGPSPKK